MAEITNYPWFITERQLSHCFYLSECSHYFLCNIMCISQNMLYCVYGITNVYIELWLFFFLLHLLGRHWLTKLHNLRWTIIQCIICTLHCVFNHLKWDLCPLSFTRPPCSPPSPTPFSNHHTIVHVHQFFLFLFAQSLHPSCPYPDSCQPALLSMNLSLFCC